MCYTQSNVCANPLNYGMCYFSLKVQHLLKLNHLAVILNSSTLTFCVSEALNRDVFTDCNS